MPRTALSVKDKFRSLILEATADELEWASDLALLKRDYIVGGNRTAEPKARRKPKGIPATEGEV